VWADWERIGRRIDWRAVVARCLPSHDLLIAVGGSDYFSSPNCAYEWEFASYAGIRRVRLENALDDLLATNSAHQDQSKQVNESMSIARSLTLYTTSTHSDGWCCSAAYA
jgi:hypothetical protein